MKITLNSTPIHGHGAPFFLIAGPCVLENDTLPLAIGKTMRDICQSLGIPYIFKASYDKANRTSASGFRGPGLEAGLQQLHGIGRELGVPVLTDVHSEQEAIAAAQYVDVLQIPAFLCRQTDLLKACAESGRCVNVKKGQFLAPWDMKYVAEKIRAFGCQQFMLTERGASFGYNTLVTDMRSFPIMKGFGAPIVMDATHSVQQPGGLGGASGGQREYAPFMARAAIAVGADGIFAETHPDPDKALSDGPNMISLDQMEKLLSMLVRIKGAISEA